MNVRIFGREPVVVSNFIEGLLAMALAFKILNPIGIDTAEEMAVIMAVVSSGLGLYVAYVTKDTLLGAMQGFVKATIVLFAAFGYNLTSEQTGALLGIVVLGAAIWHRTQTGPAIVPSLDLKQHSVEVPPEGEATNTTVVVNQSTGALQEKATGETAPPDTGNK
jgi:hypothetical protein